MPSPTIKLPREALYFPTIHFHDEGWLRASLCIWERVHRIVPEGYQTNDSDDVRHLTDEGLIGSIFVSHTDREATAYEFSKLIEAYGATPDAWDGNSENLARLHKGKVGERLHAFFERAGLDRKSYDGEGEQADDWMRILPGLAHAYMMHLAGTMARRRQMVKVTDDLDSFATSPFFDNDGHLSDHGYDEHAVYGHAVLGLTNAVPKGVEHFSVDQLLQFRSRTRDGRCLMAQQVDQLATDLSRIEDPETFRERLSDAVADLRQSQLEVMRQANGTPEDFANGAICVGLSMGMGTMGLLAAGAGAPGPWSPLSIVAGALVAVVTTTTYASVMARTRVDPLRSYYVAMQNEVKALFRSNHPGRGTSFEAILEEYLND